MTRLLSIDSRHREFSFLCGRCDELHRGPPSFAHEKPPYYFDVPEADRDRRIVITEDLCAIEPARPGDGDPIFAIRATLDIPIIGTETSFCWGVWVTQSHEAYRRYAASFDTDQSGDGSFGWLPVVMPHYQQTTPGEFIEHLACDVQWGAKGQRPKVLVHKCEHPLYADQTQGIEWERAVAIARHAMHGPTT